MCAVLGTWSRVLTRMCMLQAVLPAAYSKDSSSGQSAHYNACPQWHVQHAAGGRRSSTAASGAQSAGAAEAWRNLRTAAGVNLPTKGDRGAACAVGNAYSEMSGSISGLAVEAAHDYDTSGFSTLQPITGRQDRSSTCFTPALYNYFLLHSIAHRVC